MFLPAASEPKTKEKRVEGSNGKRQVILCIMCLEMCDQSFVESKKLNWNKTDQPCLLCNYRDKICDVMPIHFHTLDPLLSVYRK